MGRAEAHYRRAIALAPMYSDAWNNLGIIAQNHHNPKGAIECYLTALRYNPRYAPSWGNLGACFEQSGRQEAAIAVYQVALALKPSPEILSNLAGLYRERGRFDVAYACYRRALALPPTPNRVHIHSAWVFTVDQDPSSKIEDRARVKREFRSGL